MQFHAVIQPAQYIIALYTWHSLIIVPQRKPNIVTNGGKNTRLEKRKCVSVFPAVAEKVGKSIEQSETERNKTQGYIVSHFSVTSCKNELSTRITHWGFSRRIFGVECVGGVVLTQQKVK